jgi:hypothetical protein
MVQGYGAFMREIFSYTLILLSHFSRWRGFAVLLLIVLSNSGTAQDLQMPSRVQPEQLLQYYRSLKDPSLRVLLPASLNDGKCSFGINAQIQSHWNEFSISQKTELLNLIQADTTMECHTIIGHFRISYDTSATSARRPKLLNTSGPSWSEYVDSVGKIFNHVWDVEIDTMGYAPPIFQDGQSYYNIYIQELTDYGGMQFDAPSLNGQKCASYINIDNDYQGFFSPGINGLKVTAAHEFQHAIQVGSYGYWGEAELYAYELTATWFEDVVYPAVNDYLAYLHNYFYGFSSGLSLNTLTYRGYERCVWAHFMAKKYGSGIMKEVWERWTQSFLASLDIVLALHGSSLRTAFAEFTDWNYYTADRADTVNYYPEGNLYPRYKPYQTIAFTHADVTIGGDVYPLSSSMYEFDLPTETLTTMIANVDVDAAKIRQTFTKRVDVTLSSQFPMPPYYEYENGLKAKVVVEDTSLWQSSYSHASSIRYVLKELENVAPNPFKLDENHQLFLPVHDDENGLADVYFYSSSLSLVYTTQVSVTYRKGGMVLAVPGSEIHSQLASGIYFINAKTKKENYQWKVAIVR